MHVFGKKVSSFEVGIVVALVAIIAAGGVYMVRVIQERNELRKDLASTSATLESTGATLASCEINLSEVQQAYSLARENASELLAQLRDEKDRNEDFEDQIDNLSGTVGLLDKLSKLDSELLQKYSKVYFLNEHYAPERFKQIDEQYVVGDDVEHIDGNVWPYLRDLLEEADDDGVNLLVASAFRSFDEQGSLKGAYTVTYGTGANTFSADQGYSEHQLGTTVDFTSEENGKVLDSFDTTEAYAWLLKNAYKYGFVLSYPKDNGYYIFEPWHWRFVGKDLARDLHRQEKNFYDLEQREIDTYLISIFD